MIKPLLKMTVLFLPALVMLFLIAGNIYNQKTGEVWRIPIVGYDPRDILRGHYLIFNYDWNWEKNTNKCKEKSCALCLKTNDGDVSHTASLTEIDAVRQCNSFIRGRVYSKGRFEIGLGNAFNLRRYYIGEKYAKKLDTILRNNDDAYDFEISLRVSASGKAYIDGMYINDMPLENWVKHNHSQ